MGACVIMDKLKIGYKLVDAVFFHLPTEPYGYLSNWYLATFDIDGIHFTSTEQYIMYQKSIAFGDHESAKAILATNDPKTQQSIGHYVKGYLNSVWAGMRQLIAVRGLYAKFSQNEELSNVRIMIQLGPVESDLMKMSALIQVNGVARTYLDLRSWK